MLFTVKQSEWSRNRPVKSESERDHQIDVIRDEWPQPVHIGLKEGCARNFRAATSSESLRQFACACCAECVNVSDRKVERVEEIDLELMRDRTDCVLDKSRQSRRPLLVLY